MIWTESFAKYMSLIPIIVCTFIFGLLPRVLGINVERTNSISNALSYCFVAGIYLSTSMVYILPKVRQDLTNWTEIVFCIGFFAFNFLDIILAPGSATENSTIKEEGDHLLANMESNGMTNPQNTSRQLDANNKNNDNNTTESVNNLFDDKSSNSIPKNDVAIEISSTTETVNKENNQNNSRRQTYGTVDNTPNVNSDEEPENLYSVPVTSDQFLFLILIYGATEGLLIGLQSSVNEVLLLLIAIGFFKLMLSFNFGMLCNVNNVPGWLIFVPLTVNILGSVSGLLTGISICNHNISSHTISIIQCIIGGIFLYIVVCEIIPNERRRNCSSIISFFQLLFMIMGFIVMTGLNHILV